MEVLITMRQLVIYKIHFQVVNYDNLICNKLLENAKLQSFNNASCISKALLNAAIVGPTAKPFLKYLWRHRLTWSHFRSFLQLRVDCCRHWWWEAGATPIRSSNQDTGLGRERSGSDFPDLEVCLSAVGGNENRYGRASVSGRRWRSRGQRKSQILSGRRGPQESGKWFKAVCCTSNYK